MRPKAESIPREGAEALPAILLESPTPSAFMVLAHGAGAGMEHPFMEGVSGRLADAGVTTLRFQFPYMAAGRRRPDRAPTLVSAWEDAMTRGRALADGLPLVAGGKSLGGRMASHAAAEGRLPGARGLVFFGFPLHPAGKPGTGRADHLSAVGRPMLFLQGTRDALADLGLLRPVLEALGPAATLHVVEGADHGFHVLKRSGRTDPEVLDELARTAAGWVTALTPGGGHPGAHAAGGGAPSSTGAV